MSSDLMINVEDLGKKYVIGHQIRRERYAALRDVLMRKARALGRSAVDLLHGRTNGAAGETEDFWALKGVQFEVRRGEVLGIIGRNGAGKSTLLKILSRITEPTEGRVEIRGRVASLLEVGTGFHPELTGRENIYLNGAILGMSRAEIRNRFEEIVAFADVEQFLDTPVKRYSSGMYVRLAFAVAAHLESDILVIDEVLAVGDIEFQKKCLGRMESISKQQGRTILFVSHSVPAIRALCSRAVVMGNGRILGEGNVEEMVQTYANAASDFVSSNWERPEHASDNSPVLFKRIEARLAGRQPKLRLTITADVVCRRRSGPKLLIAVDLCDAVGTPLMQALPLSDPFIDFEQGTYQVEIEIQLPPLVPGRYAMDLWLGSHYTSTEDCVKGAVAIDIDDDPSVDRSYPRDSNHGYLVPESCCRYNRVSSDLATADRIRP